MKWLRSIKREYVILACMIAVQVIYLTCMFAANKQGFHSDELWEYGIGNAAWNEYRYDGNVLIPTKTNEWIESKHLKEYITVSRDEIFDYKSAYMNSSNDYNPPLSYMMMHLICSFFVDKWSMWYGFALNMMYFVVTQIFVYKLTYSITKKEYASLLSVAFFGFTMGAQEIFTYIRFYAPGTMLTVIALYYASELYNNRDNKETHKKLLIKLFVFNLLGFLTLHLAVVAAFAITAMYCLYYLVTKRFRLMFKYGFTLLGAFVASVALYPRTIYNLFMPTSEYDYATSMYPFDMQVRYYWAFITNDIFGVHTSVWHTMTLTYIGYVILIAVLLILPLMFVFRKEVWLKKILAKVSDAAKLVWNKVKHPQYTYLVMAVTVCFILFMDSIRTSVYGMGIFTNRYAFIAYPMLAILFVAVVTSVAVWIKDKKAMRIVCCMICMLFCVLSNILSYNNYYQKHQETGISLKDIESDANSIVLLSSEWLLICFTNEIGETAEFFATTYDTAMEAYYRMDSIDATRPLYLIIDESEMDKGEQKKIHNKNENLKIENAGKSDQYKKDEYLDFYENLDGATKCELVGTDAIFARPVEIYRLN